MCSNQGLPKNGLRRPKQGPCTTPQSMKRNNRLLNVNIIVILAIVIQAFIVFYQGYPVYWCFSKISDERGPLINMFLPLTHVQEVLKTVNKL